MTQGKITLPHTFQGGGYEVTVNADRSIKVRQGDWLSKYSMAIYGDFNHIDKFWRKKQGETKKEGELWEEIRNKDLINTGETLYHRDPLPGESTAPEPRHEIPASVIDDFLKWVKQKYIRSEWWVETSGGSNFGLLFGTVQKLTVGIRNRRPRLGPEEEIIWFHALASGVTIGYPDLIVSGSYSNVDFWSRPWPILRSPWFSRLTHADFLGGIVVVDFGFSLLYGKSVVFVFFGLGFPPARIIEEARRYFFYGDTGALMSLLKRGQCKGVAILEGLSWGLPGGGIACRAGYMSDLRAPWKQR